MYYEPDRPQLTDHSKEHITPWEVAFIILAGAFTLEEYTAATEHGWISKLLHCTPIVVVLTSYFHHLCIVDIANVRNILCLNSQ